MFKKKYRRRVKHYNHSYFCVEFCNYRLIPLFYNTVNEYLTIVNTYQVKLMSLVEAQEFAKNLNSYEDAVKYNDAEYAKFIEYKSKKLSLIDFNKEINKSQK